MIFGIFLSGINFFIFYFFFWCLVCKCAISDLSLMKGQMFPMWQVLRDHAWLPGDTVGVFSDICNSKRKETMLNWRTQDKGNQCVLIFYHVPDTMTGSVHVWSHLTYSRSLANRKKLEFRIKSVYPNLIFSSLIPLKFFNRIFLRCIRKAW